MKVGDLVFSSKVRPDDIAKIIKVDLHKTPTYTRTVYTAKFDDGSTFIFYGSQVNKSVFKHIKPDGQISIFDFMNPPEVDNDNK